MDTMSFRVAVRSVLSQYAAFGGRARRSELWQWMIVQIIGWLLALVVLEFAGPVGIAAYLIFGLATITPTLAVLVRRMHDTGSPGWTLVYAIAPVIGWIAVLIMLCKPGDDDANAYGSPSKPTPFISVPQPTYAAPPPQTALGQPTSRGGIQAAMPPPD
jgi:uncharacterized membrane protein YhaH (DUF805 family)